MKERGTLTNLTEKEKDELVDIAMRKAHEVFKIYLLRKIIIGAARKIIAKEEASTSPRPNFGRNF